MRVLVVEDDADAAEDLTRGLRRHGFDADIVDTGTDALKRYHDVDLVLLDLELPDVDGLEVCRDIRANCNTPIIAVTESDTELDRVLGLQAGSDDCLVKPYGFRELMARIDAVMRRVNPPQRAAQVLSHGRLQVDVGAREVRIDGRLVGLTRKEFDLLHLLAHRPDSVVTREHMMSKVWGFCDMSSSRTIDTHVSSVRSKLGSSQWIVTVRGVGFRLGHG